MTTWVSCCCDSEAPDPVLFFVPCPNSPTCAPEFGYFALTSRWVEILGETPAVGDVYQFDDGSRPACVWCGKFQTGFPGGGSAAPDSGFRKMSGCDDSECPTPHLFFVPCDANGCNTYTMAATPAEWETFLSLPVDSIDINDPATYQGTWLFERSDGQECCETDPDTGDPVEAPCFKFCGTLSASGSTNFCFDSTAFPVSERCLKCDVPDGKTQRLFPASSVSFTSVNGCNDDDCPEDCEKQPGDGWIKLSGVKTVTCDYLVSGTRKSGNPDTCFSVATGSTTMKLGVRIEYDHYMRVNANSNDLDTINSLPVWRRVLSGHCKQECSVVRGASFITNEWSSSWEDESSGCNDNYTETYGFTGSFAFRDSTPLDFAKLEKRLGVYGHGAHDECNPDLSDTEDPPVDLQIGCFNNDCHLNYYNDTTISLVCNWDEYYTYNSDDIDEDFSGSFTRNISPINANTAMAARYDPCCPTDFVPLEMYWTDFNRTLGIHNLVLQVMACSKSFSGSSILDQMLPYQDWQHVISLPDGSGGTQVNVIEAFDLGPTSTSLYLDEDTGNMNYFCAGGATGWVLDFIDTATKGPSASIYEYSRTLDIDASIIDTIESIECVSGPPANCEDGGLDVP